MHLANWHLRWPAEPATKLWRADVESPVSTDVLWILALIPTSQTFNITNWMHTHHLAHCAHFDARRRQRKQPDARGALLAKHLRSLTNHSNSTTHHVWGCGKDGWCSFKVHWADLPPHGLHLRQGRERRRHVSAAGPHQPGLPNRWRMAVATVWQRRAGLQGPLGAGQAALHQRGTLPGLSGPRQHQRQHNPWPLHSPPAIQALSLLASVLQAAFRNGAGAELGEAQALRQQLGAAVRSLIQAAAASGGPDRRQSARRAPQTASIAFKTTAATPPEASGTRRNNRRRRPGGGPCCRRRCRQPALPPRQMPGLACTCLHHCPAHALCGGRRPVWWLQKGCYTTCIAVAHGWGGPGAAPLAHRPARRARVVCCSLCCLLLHTHAPWHCFLLLEWAGRCSHAGTGVPGTFAAAAARDATASSRAAVTPQLGQPCSATLPHTLSLLQCWSNGSWSAGGPITKFWWANMHEVGKRAACAESPDAANAHHQSASHCPPLACPVCEPAPVTALSTCPQRLGLNVFCGGAIVQGC